MAGGGGGAGGICALSPAVDLVSAPVFKQLVKAEDNLLDPSSPSFNLPLEGLGRLTISG
jgi:hypothetical protein